MGKWEFEIGNLRGPSNPDGRTIAPAAAGDPSLLTLKPTVDVEGDSYVLYRDVNGAINCLFTPNRTGYLQLNLEGQTTAPAAAGDPALSLYGKSLHVFYRAADGTIFDCWGPSITSWRPQQVNAGGLTTGPAAQTDLAISVRLKEQHVFYVAGGGGLVDCYFDGHGRWRVQQLNLGGLTPGPAAGGKPYAAVIGTVEQHVLYRTNNGLVIDCWFDGGGNWRVQQLNMGGLTVGPAANGDPKISLYGSEMHVFYAAANGELIDSWFDGGATWRVQQLNLGGLTGGIAANTDPSISVYKTQQHVFFGAAGGQLMDIWFDGSRTWRIQQMNLGGVTSAPAMGGCPYTVVNVDEQEVAYRATDGTVVLLSYLFP